MGKGQDSAVVDIVGSSEAEILYPRVSRPVEKKPQDFLKVLEENKQPISRKKGGVSRKTGGVRAVGSLLGEGPIIMPKDLVEAPSDEESVHSDTESGTKSVLSHEGSDAGSLFMSSGDDAGHLSGRSDPGSMSSLGAFSDDEDVGMLSPVSSEEALGPSLSSSASLSGSDPDEGDEGGGRKGWCGKRGGKAYPTFIVPYRDGRPGIAGRIKWNKARHSLDAHCPRCKVKVNRTYEAAFDKDGNEVGSQGRPMGRHIALLQCACMGIRIVHKTFMESLNHQDRKDARDWGLELEELQVPFGLERRRRLDESDDEPEAV